MLQSGQTSLEGGADHQAANSLNMLLKKSKKPAVSPFFLLWAVCCPCFPGSRWQQHVPGVEKHGGGIVAAENGCLGCTWHAWCVV